MKTLVILLIALLFFFVVPSIIVSSKNPDFKPGYLTNKKILEHRRSNCCPEHGGVCGCNEGKVLCCDGTISTICT